MESIKKLPPDRRLRAKSLLLPPTRGTLPSLYSPSPSASGIPRRLSTSLTPESPLEARSPTLSPMIRQSPAVRTPLDRTPLSSLSVSPDGKKSISARLGGASSAKRPSLSAMPTTAPANDVRRRSHSTPLYEPPATVSPQLPLNDATPTKRNLRASVTSIEAAFTKTEAPPSEQRSRVMQEADTQHVFVILGSFAAVRPSLLHRSWVERDMGKVRRARIGLDLSGVEFARQCSVGSTGHESEDDDDDPDADDIQEMLLQRPPDFIWANSRDELDTRTLRPTQIVNFFRNNTAITTQLGLSLCLRKPPLDITVDTRTFYPRCHLLSDPSEVVDFIDDFRISAAIAVVTMASKWHPPTQVLQLALQACEHYLHLQDHLQLDETGHSAALNPNQWSALVCYHYGMTGATTARPQAVPDAAELSSSDEESELFAQRSPPPRPSGQKVKKRVTFAAMPAKDTNRIARPPTGRRERSAAGVEVVEEKKPPPVEGAEALATLLKARCIASIDPARVASVTAQLEEIEPQLGMGGVHNVWVVSPLSRAHGRTRDSTFRGVLENRLSYLLDTSLGGAADRGAKWLVQKYIERPLLIEGRKFHVRQIFVVTNWRPLHLWLYKISHIHILSAPFDPAAIRTPEGLAGHLCQAATRHKGSDDVDFLTSTQLIERLAISGQGWKWEEQIRPQMVDCITTVLRSAEDHVENRLNSFELFAADCCVDEKFRLWLTSVAGTPWTTPCPAIPDSCWPAIMEDLAKVVLDRRVSKYADTGGFEFIPPRQSFGSSSLQRGHGHSMLSSLTSLKEI